MLFAEWFGRLVGTPDIIGAATTVLVVALVAGISLVAVSGSTVGAGVFSIFELSSLVFGTGASSRTTSLFSVVALGSSGGAI